jgi:hypothetical protein
MSFYIKIVIYLLLSAFSTLEIVFGLFIGPKNVSECEEEFNKSQYVLILDKESSQEFASFNSYQKKKWSFLAWSGGMIILSVGFLIYSDLKNKNQRIKNIIHFLVFSFLILNSSVLFLRGLYLDNLVYYYVYLPKLLDNIKIPTNYRQDYADYVLLLGEQWGILKYFGIILMLLTISLLLIKNLNKKLKL